MEKRHLITVITTAIIGIAGTITFLVLFLNTGKKYDNSVIMGVTMVKSFYQAKDTATCLLNVTGGEERFEKCRPYVNELIDNYKSINNVFDNDLSTYR